MVQDTCLFDLFIFRPLELFVVILDQGLDFDTIHVNVEQKEIYQLRSLRVTS
jgi:hypothetical protein